MYAIVHPMFSPSSVAAARPAQSICHKTGKTLEDLLEVCVTSIPSLMMIDVKGVVGTAAIHERSTGVADGRTSGDKPEQVSLSSGDERDGKCAECEPPEPHRKPTSSIWVQVGVGWWIRSKDISEADQSPLRVSNTIPTESKLSKTISPVARSLRQLLLPPSKAATLLGPSP
ncbi:hypothetical protein K503DRAFT_116133 [Rhizopogon vinicolor AM-OR11-026]|uniref:Uncharacterized protein n=1 Tax=Rhizopogon vinicolor AM-OR11-026 TaxID=1314800 RepID=A0A1B7N2F5_9AGAM|nr:hypothetical protein K503DRAFT_116133 [Rhizopogon vinicolor AM-OR11-026]